MEQSHYVTHNSTVCHLTLCDSSSTPVLFVSRPIRTVQLDFHDSSSAIVAARRVVVDGNRQSLATSHPHYLSETFNNNRYRLLSISHSLGCRNRSDDTMMSRTASGSFVVTLVVVVVSKEALRGRKRKIRPEY